VVPPPIQKMKMVPTPTSSPLPPCRPGPTVLESRPTKKIRITPTLISNNNDSATTTKTTAQSPTATTTIASKKSPNNAKRRAPETEEVGDAVNKLSLDNHNRLQSGEKPKKKKRIQPMLISTA